MKLTGWNLSERTIEIIASMLSPDSKILELGSGKGSLAMAEAGFRVFTVEHNKRWLQKFKHPRLQYAFVRLLHDSSMKQSRSIVF